MRLEIKNLCKTYKKGVVKALDDFSVTLTPGVYGLLRTKRQQAKAPL